jgi:hypothetical protein
MQQLIKPLLVCYALLLFTSQKVHAQYIVLTPSQFSISDLAVTLLKLKQYANQVYISLPGKSSDNGKIQQLARQYGMSYIEDDVLYSDVTSKKNDTSDISLYSQENSLVKNFNSQHLDASAFAIIHKTLSQTYNYSTLFWKPSALDATTYVSYSDLHYYVQFTNPDTTFSISSNTLEIDKMTSLVQLSKSNKNKSPFAPTLTNKEYIAIHGCSINKDATFNVVVSFNKNFGDQDKPYAKSINIITINSKLELMASRSVGNIDTTSHSTTVYNLFGDSILALTTVYKANNTYKIELYKNIDNQFKYTATLPIKVNPIFSTLFPLNYTLPNIYRYPYFTTYYDNEIYNIETNSFITLRPEKTYKNFVSRLLMEYTGDKNLNTKKIRNYYQIHDLYYNKANEKLYVVYHENMECYLNIYDKDNILIKKVHLDKSFGSSSDKVYHYSFNEQFKTLVQTFQINKETQSHTIPINFL